MVLKGARSRSGKWRNGLRFSKQKRVDLEKSIASLSEEKDVLTQVRNDVVSLAGQKDLLQRTIDRMQETKEELGSEIEALEKKTSDLKEMEAKYNELSANIIALEKEIGCHKNQIEMLNGFLGFVEPSSYSEIEKFVTILPALLDDAKQKRYSPELLRDYILETLSGRTLRVLMCTSCNARFAVDKPSKYSLGYCCPACSSSLVKVVKDEGDVLKAGLAEQPPLRLIPRRIGGQDVTIKLNPDKASVNQ